MAGRAAASCLFALLMAAGCDAAAPGDTVWLRIRGTGRLSAAAIRYTPEDAVQSARLGADWLAIERRSASRAITVQLPEYCPLTIPAGTPPAALQLTPIVDLGGDRPPLGFSAKFSVSVAHGCPERGRGQLAWRQTAGPPLRELVISRDGFALSARTASFEELHPEPLRADAAGIVPFSPRTQGRAVLEATWTGPFGRTVVRSVAIPATSRASGVPSVAVSQQLVLAGTGYRVKSAPPAAHAEALASGAVSLFTPDAPGRWLLEREAGASLTLDAFWHDKTPYDCGRSECHAQLAADTEGSPMSHALERQLNASAAVSCALDCHVLGERGLDDGGFLDVAGELGFTRFDGLRWQDLPQPLRRLGGVRCTACHGPGAIPPPEGRTAILRSDVCATCHDAPPRYVHVQEWRASRMARSDAAESTRSGRCAACHTTAGFLAAIGARSARSVTEPSGIACAACHAPHSTHRGPRLLRTLPDATAGLEPATALCVRCHSPEPGSLQPSAAAVPIFLGRVRVPGTTDAAWELVQGPSAHGAVSRGCIGCHGASTARVDHSFRSDLQSCATCHADMAPLLRAGRELQEHARRLQAELSARCPMPEAARPPHAGQATASCSAPRFDRARYEVQLVLEDPAAGVHNAAFARELLRDAERQLSD